MSIKSSLRRKLFFLRKWIEKRFKSRIDKTHIPFEVQRVLALVCLTMSNTTENENEHFSLFSGMILHQSHFFLDLMQQFTFLFCSSKVTKVARLNSNVRAPPQIMKFSSSRSEFIIFPSFCRFHVRRRFVRNCRKSEINTKSKVMSCWLREQMANRSLTSIWFRLRNEYKSSCFSLSSSNRDPGGKEVGIILVIKILVYVPQTIRQNHELWSLKFSEDFCPESTTRTLISKFGDCKKSCPKFCNGRIVVNLISNQKKNI